MFIELTRFNEDRPDTKVYVNIDNIISVNENRNGFHFLTLTGYDTSYGRPTMLKYYVRENYKQIILLIEEKLKE